MISFEKDVVQDYHRATSREWIVTNGLGGYASSTIIGLNTRGYHGLLVAALEPPLKRTLLLSRIEEKAAVAGKEYNLSANKYPGVIYPKGYECLDEFRLDPVPVFSYRFGKTVLSKTVFMVHGENTTVVTYRVDETDQPVSLSLLPLVNCRDFHGRTQRSQGMVFRQEARDRAVALSTVPPCANLYLTSDLATYSPGGEWYYKFVFDEEAARGQRDKEDNYQPGSFTAELGLEESASLIASDHADAHSPQDELRKEKERLAHLETLVPDLLLLPKVLVTAADSFIVARHSTANETVIAGYHWFGDWGRDAMISLPGLSLVTGRYQDAKRILLSFSHYLKQGLIPNTFPEGGEEAEYNTMDATLWFIYAVYKYFEYTGDTELLRTLYPKLQDIVHWHNQGTKHNIRLDADGLLSGGEEGYALTWMDAVVEGRAVTPRVGKPVEINALWYNALKCMEFFSTILDEGESSNYRRMAENAEKSFNRVFWNEREKCLYDCVENSERDESTRPNQIFAISLPYPVVSGSKQLDILEVVERDLLTPFGLRSLTPRDSRYIGRYTGNRYSRDSAYHQGTVWAWLIGPYVTAHVRARGKGEAVRSEAKNLLDRFYSHLTEAGVGTVSEIFDGDPPHTPRGCISQAWSVAEIMRAYCEDVLQRRRPRALPSTTLEPEREPPDVEGSGQ